MEVKARRDRRYPELKVGDRVKIMLKFNQFKTEHNPIYSDMTYEIGKIEEKHGLKLYTVDGCQRLRDELIFY